MTANVRSECRCEISLRYSPQALVSSKNLGGKIAGGWEMARPPCIRSVEGRWSVQRHVPGLVNESLVRSEALLCIRRWAFPMVVFESF